MFYVWKIYVELANFKGIVYISLQCWVPKLGEVKISPVLDATSSVLGRFGFHEMTPGGWVGSE